MKETITYIKNNEEITIKVNKFNRRKLKKELFENSNKCIVIKSDIEYIHFKNVDLSKIIKLKESSTRIKCDYKTMCILENCITNESDKIYFLLGDCFQLINFNPKTTLKVKHNYCREIIIDNSKLENSERNIDISTFDGCKKIELKDNQTIKELYINCDDIYLTGKFLLDTLTARSDNELKIGTKTDSTKIVMTDNKYPLVTLDAYKLELNNCTIINDTERPTYINYKLLSTNNFTLKTKGRIIVNSALMHQIKKDEDGYYILTDKDLLRLEINKLLKQRAKIITDQIKSQTRDYILKNQNKKLISNIERQNQIIKKEQKLLVELKEELYHQDSIRKENITKSLTKKKIRYFK